ncbi:MAG: hypothetical protein KGM99_19610, partial [Burkholderiales bacterium]|nr:hypothetical protein [Burkholderiales bacterium]
EKYFKFPIKLYSPTDTRGIDEKPLVISKKIFLKDYVKFFRKDDGGNEIKLYTALKRNKGKESLEANNLAFNKEGCSDLQFVRVDDYSFTWSKVNGWQITSIIYEDYSLLISD